MQRISDVLLDQQNQTQLPGMWPVIFNAPAQSFREDTQFTFGGRADSLYEYIPKQFVLLGGARPEYETMYAGWLATGEKYAFFSPLNPQNRDVLLPGTVSVSEADGSIALIPQGQHLACFLGGVVAMAARVFDRPRDLETAKKLVDGCVWAAESTVTGMPPEVFSAVPAGKKRVLAGNKKWDRGRWLRAVGERQSDRVAGVREEKDLEELVRELRLPEGMTGIEDGRYLLRCVHGLG